MKELLFDCGTNLTPKHGVQQPGRQGVDPDQGLLSIYLEDNRDLEQNIHLVITFPGELQGGDGLHHEAFRVVSVRDLPSMLANTEVGCRFLFLIC